MLLLPWDLFGFSMECCKGQRHRGRLDLHWRLLASAALRGLPVWCRPFIRMCLCSIHSLPGHCCCPCIAPQGLGKSHWMWRLTGRVSSQELLGWWNSQSPERFPLLFFTSSSDYWLQHTHTHTHTHTHKNTYTNKTGCSLLIGVQESLLPSVSFSPMALDFPITAIKPLALTVDVVESESRSSCTH